MATFYVIGTPIGNLEDITLRALRILKEVDIILCEDTQTTRKLLQKYEITTQTQSYHSQSNENKTEYILSLLEEGKNLALVSDAGTPGISDPGTLLISAIRKRFVEVNSGHDRNKEGNEASGVEQKVQIVPIPGPSAIVSALSVSGLPTAEFVFLGFLPHKKGRQTLFKEIAESERTTVFYESPHRIIKTLESLSEVLSVSRKMVVARELTKMFEEITFSGAPEALSYFNNHPDKVRGEFTVLVGPISFEG